MHAFFSRITDVTKPPRRWWWPKYSLDESLNEEQWQEQHDETSRTILHVLLTILAFGFFCLIVLGQPDIRLVQHEAIVKLPLANTDVSYEAFLFIAPLIILGLTAYLHVFVGYWSTLGHKKGRAGRAVIPYIFNIHSVSGIIISGFLLYWFVPCVLFAFAWKTVSGHFGTFFILLASLTMCVLLFLQIRRWPKTNWKQRRPRWSIWPYRMLWLSLSIAVSTVLVQLWAGDWPIFYRRINLFRADLSGQDLFGRMLIHGRLAEANLQGANMRYGQLSWAWMSGINLQDADLSGSVMWEVLLDNANLKNTILRFVDLTGSHLRSSDLTNGDLKGASLEGADLEGAILDGANLEDASITGVNWGFGVDPCAKLKSAKNWQKAYRDQALACGTSIPEKPRDWFAGRTVMGPPPPWLRRGAFWVR